MFSYVAKVAMAAGLAALLGAASFSQTENFRINPDRSTVSLFLVFSSNSNLPVDLAVAMAAGTVRLDLRRIGDSRLWLTIFPAGQQSSLLNSDGSFRSDGLAALPEYTLLSFESSNAAWAGDGKVTFNGHLTAIHVQRESSVAWNNSYSGALPDRPIVETDSHQITFVADVSGLGVEVSNSGVAASHNLQIAKSIATATVKRSDFAELIRELQQSAWPLVIFNERCRMPYYPALTARDYSGADCTGAPMLPKPQPEPSHHYYPANNIGMLNETARSFDSVTMVAHLQLEASRP
jgi:hypothetical protein